MRYLLRAFALALLFVSPLAKADVVLKPAGVPSDFCFVTGAQAFALNTATYPTCTTAGALRVDGSGVTQPVSGTVNVGNFPTTQPVSEASGANVALGSTTDTATSATIMGRLLSIKADTTRIQGASAFTDTLTALAASATFTGTNHTTGVANGSGATPYAYVNVVTFSDQGGTVFVEQSVDGTTFYPLNGTAGAAVTANGTYTGRFPATMPTYRVRYTNGATAQTKFAVTSSFSGS